MLSNLTFNNARIALTFNFVFFFFSIVLLLIFPFLKSEITSETLIDLMKKVISIYSVHFGVIIGGIFGKDVSSEVLASKTPFWLAFVLTLIWNILITWPMIIFSFTTMSTDQDVSDYIDAIPTLSSFLVSGSLAYFFAKK
jgi:fatty acid desaturase